MAKSSFIEREKKRKRMAQQYAKRRLFLKTKIRDKNLPFSERFEYQLKLAQLPRNSSPVRQHNRCVLSGRPRGYYRKFGLSRIALRSLASEGMIPGVIKSSW